MASIFHTLAAIIFFALVSKGSSQCTLDSITITQSKTGKLVQDKQEWKVTISNSCICTQTQLKLSCNGFQSVEEIDPSVLSKSGDECVVNNGNPVYNGNTINFNYAWDVSFPFTPLSSQIACS